MSNKNKLPNWYDIYPQGTQEGEEEKIFFIALIRNPKYKNWRSISALTKETNLSPEKIEKIIYKYHKIGIIIQKPDNSEFWGYYYNNLDIILDEPLSAIEEERKNILNKLKKN